MEDTHPTRQYIEEVLWSGLFDEAESITVDKNRDSRFVYDDPSKGATDVMEFDVINIRVVINRKVTPIKEWKKQNEKEHPILWINPITGIRHCLAKEKILEFAEEELNKGNVLWLSENGEEGSYSKFYDLDKLIFKLDGTPNKVIKVHAPIGHGG